MKLPLLSMFIILAPAVVAFDAAETAVLTLDALNFLAAILCIIFALGIVTRTGAVLGRAFVFITASLFFFGAIRVFFYVAEQLAVSDTTVIVGWHFLFYVAAALLIAALQSLKSFGSGFTKEKLISPMMVVLFTALTLIGVAILLSIGSLDESITLYYGAASLHHFGLEHFIAFIMMAYTTYLIVSVKHLFGKTVTNAVAPMLAATVSFTLLHVWELLTENWGVLAVPETIIEPVEGVFFLIAMLSMLIATWQIRKGV